MNEYQDQDVWFEMQLLTGDQVWLTLFDVDTTDEAGRWMEHLESEYPAETYRVKRVSGLAT